ncbi:alpha-galactosidase [Phytomonospora endophytica]|uniref:Alpha-galactosidase n=1 Tax=Phytomonospora endophytica TaxID=714109 RepID=A0A841FLD5_9ACTN|nr:alpha-galactosidase [Phytomonospora endophytica]MBB6038141.1 alpha-galactosidase [Phytomonospora endophytica]GIG67396.1 alpha-galactosidase [Phytomonospora endophytica]
MTHTLTGAPVVLTAGAASIVIDTTGPGLPRVLHWGGRVTSAPTVEESRDALGAVLLPAQCDGWMGRPGVSGHRDGGGPHLRLTVAAPPAVHIDPAGGGSITVDAMDDLAGIDVRSELHLSPEGLLRVRHTVCNTGKGVWTADGVLALLPVPAEAAEILDTTGHWGRERFPQRVQFGQSTVVHENRRGRTGFDSPPLFVAGTPGFGFRHGEVWGVHVGWSGNHVHLAQRLHDADAVLGGGELLTAGEVRLAPGGTYRTPWVYFAYSPQGLDGLSEVTHAWMRGRETHPASDRPLTLNVWEAVYFDHDLDRLKALADRAAEIGVERYVLDDGWFLGRRDDTAGLGDWHVDPEVWPEGLHPLVDHVRAAGIEFGLWVEPEMINPRSTLAGEHPDWFLAAPGRTPADQRHQQVLDIARPEAYAHILERLDAIVTEYRLTYLKWDHNRDLVEAVHDGHAGVHEQTLAAYRLIDELKSRHPGLEIESCSSGGSRVDLGILARTDRVWASDMTDGLERQHIQRWVGLLVPPEIVGAHVSAPVNHQMGRVTGLRLRTVTALFGHAGIEWDITTCTPAELAELADWIAAYKRLRPTLHTGRTVRVDHPDESAHLYGIVSPDRDHAVFAYAQLATSASTAPVRLRLPGLDPEAEYAVTLLPEIPAPDWRGEPWKPEVLRSGETLAGYGLTGPVLRPADAYVLELRRI